MITSRRSLFGFGAALIAAPAIVRVASIMPVGEWRRVSGYERYLPYDATTHTLSISAGPLTLDDIRRFKAVLALQPIEYVVPVPLEWEKAISRGRLPA